MNSFIRKPFRYTYKNVCLILILINAGVFLLANFLKMCGIDYIIYLALAPFLTIDYKMFWQVFTYQFLHYDLWHILCNMLVLYFFGTPLEQKLGSKEFLLFYLLCGTLSGVAGLFAYYYLMPNILIIGASGAVFAVMFLFAVLYPESTIYIWGIIPVRTPIFMLIYIGLELFGTLFAHDNVAHLIHLFGLFWAFLYVRIRFGIRPMRMWRNLLR